MRLSNNWKFGQKTKDIPEKYKNKNYWLHKTRFKFFNLKSPYKKPESPFDLIKSKINDKKSKS